MATKTVTKYTVEVRYSCGTYACSAGNQRASATGGPTDAVKRLAGKLFPAGFTTREIRPNIWNIAATPLKIELQEKVDELKSNWFEWACIAVMPDGQIIDGTVQADGSGDLIAKESFTPDNPTKI